MYLMLLFLSPLLSITLFSIWRISSYLRALKPGIGEQQKPEARTSCLKDRDMPGEMQWVDGTELLVSLARSSNLDFK